MDLPSPPNPGAGCFRNCAALDTEISVSDCRRFRGSRLPCPSRCSHYPFGSGGHDCFLRLEAGWTTKATHHILASIGRDRFDQLIREGSLLCDDADHTALESGLIHAIHYSLAYAVDASGHNLVDAWASRGYAQLNNDEQQFTRFRSNAYVTVVQVQEIMDGERLLCRDLFEPARESFLVLDRATAAHAAIGVRLMSWLTHFPHFSRLGGIEREISAHLWVPWRQAVEALFEKERVREPRILFKSWLSRRAGTCSDLLDSLTSDRTLSSRDFSHRLTQYALQGRCEEVLSVLQSKPDFQPVVLTKCQGQPIATFRWICQGETKKLAPPPTVLFQLDSPDDGIGCLGSLYLYSDRLVLETFTESKYALAHNLLSDYLEGLVSGNVQLPT